MGEVLSDRIAEIYKFYDENIMKTLGEEIKDIFVTEYISNKGVREYENVWFFTNRYAMEAKLFKMRDEFDISPLAKEILYINIIKSNYEYKCPNEESRLLIEYSASFNSNKGYLKASKENCDRLMEITLKYLVPNLM
jgi:hypothetical protein